MTNLKTFVQLGVLLASIVGPFSASASDVIINFATGQCLGVAGESSDDGAPVVQDSAYCSGDQMQTWDIGSPFTDGRLVYINSKTQKCLDVPDGSAEFGTLLQQWTCTRYNYNQRWSRKEVGDGYFNLISAKGVCLDVPGGSTQTGTPLQIWGCSDGNENQIFSMLAR